MKRRGRLRRALGQQGTPGLANRLTASLAQSTPGRSSSVTHLLRRAAGHDAVWLGAAAVLGASGGRSARRAALRGIGSVAIVAGINHALAKPAARSSRPLLDALPGVFPRPSTSSLPSSTMASAAAFASGVVLESPRYGAAALPFAAGLAYVRAQGGLDHRRRAAAGALVGIGAALLTCRWWPVKPEAAAAAAPPRKPAPALKEGKGLQLIVNPSSGVAWSKDTAETLRTLLPEAAITLFEPGDDLLALLDRAAVRAVAEGGALGVCGGDGTVNAGSATAARHRVPLAVFPGGTFNHFAVDLGNQTMDDVVRAIQAGDAVTADVGRATSAGDDEQKLFLNTFSIGVYSELVHARERLEKRIGKWPALVVGLAKVLATGSPLSVVINGRARRIWLLFAGNGIYHPAGFAPTYRTQLDDGLLDVRAVEAGTPLARTRLLLAVLTGTLHSSRVLTTAQVRRLELEVLDGEPHLAYDGEVTDATYRHLVLDKIPQAVTLYRPADQDQWLR
ncbi:diacylglycerol kinase family protein [Streptomyces sp. NBC_00083]|uniref:diacylglycerol/lipid kinase family protein n=1 Tax=Streptomyces sp. NBC_00083 TaxID=2975647 RepID=UPI00224E4F81|nr:diacylglycerol kinase family protein [Streptomyces sp. NBC_00083]MCX5384478.1 diacylglycerol kinase family protein [Streptomyces sp. NBC_00083]